MMRLQKAVRVALACMDRFKRELAPTAYFYKTFGLDEGKRAAEKYDEIEAAQQALRKLVM